MSAAIAAPTRGGLESLSQDQRDAAVTAYLVDARDRLALALAATGPDAVKAIKAEASVIAEMSRQVGVSKEIQDDAAEMVRRAEYALGKAVKAGQESGAVRTRGGDQGNVPEGTKAVSEYVKRGREEHDLSVMSSADPDTFDAALNEARDEGNVSRANVVRKVKERTGGSERKAPRRALTDVARDAGQELRKAVERLERIAADDRLARNKNEVAAHLRHHLAHAIKVCQDLDNTIN